MNKLCELRKKNNLTQEALAKKLYVSRQTISKWELGETKPNIEQARDLAKIFNISVDELFDEESNKKFDKKLIVIIVITLVLIGIMLFVILKNNDKNNNTDTEELTDITVLKEANEKEAANIIKNNIVRIINQIDKENSIVGTGFFVKDGYLVTNSHIVDVFGDIKVEYPDGTKKKANLYSNTIEHDIAILKVEDVLLKSLVFGNSNKLEVTNNILSAGYIYNFSGDATVSKGTLSAKRKVNGITFLQSDISIDAGSSGGPLFNDFAEVIGINTYTTQSKNFALSISSESLQTIINILLENPTIQYLDGERPKNLINSALVEVGYTDNIDLNLYNDSNIINVSKTEHKEEIKKITTNKNVVITNKEVEETKEKEERYECEEDYYLLNNICIKEIEYAPNVSYPECKDGYEKYSEDSTLCYKRVEKPVKKEKYCMNGYTYTKEGNCEKEGYIEDTFTMNSRVGSCPKGKDCYEILRDNTGVEYVSTISCPKGTSVFLTRGVKYIWSNEEFDLSNYKIYNSKKMYAYIKTIDNDGLVYYKSTYGSYVPVNCAIDYKEDENGEIIYTYMTYDELKDTACPEGTLTIAKNNNQIEGFYCKLNIDPNTYAYDVNCNSNDSEIVKEENRVYCRKWGKTILETSERSICDDGYSVEFISKENKEVCSKFDEYYEEPIYSCKDGDELRISTCIKTEKKEPKKVIVS